MGHSKLAIKYIVRSQIILYASFAICILISPASLADNSGFSYFGHHKLTIIPFGAGLLATAHYLLKAAGKLGEAKQQMIVRISLTAMAPLMAGLVVVPAIGTGWYDLIHRIFGSSLFAIQLLLAGWLVWHTRKSIINWLALVLQFTGGVISLLYLHPAQGFELQGQLLFQLAFTVILIRSIRYALAASI